MEGAAGPRRETDSQLYIDVKHGEDLRLPTGLVVRELNLALFDLTVRQGSEFKEKMRNIDDWQLRELVRADVDCPPRDA